MATSCFILFENMKPAEYSRHILLTKNLSKQYSGLVAVNKLSFCVDKGECFGLLGVNGAGKTTAFKMLTGDISISKGDAWIYGISIKSKINMVRKYIGYCPQYDGLLHQLTVRENLELFAGLKGIPKKDQQKAILHFSTKLSFIQHNNKRVNQLSGGNKRKVSTTVALLGNPDIAFMDEPTTGMDPIAKRQVWKIILERNGGCVILTTHSMEECEALCSRIVIMFKGQFHCLGSLQHIKNKFSQGFKLKIKLKKVLPSSSNASTQDEAALLSIPADSFNEEVYQGLLTYHITDPHTKVSQIFHIVEKGNKTLDIEDYSVAQTSLDEVFLKMTRTGEEVA